MVSGERTVRALAATAVLLIVSACATSRVDPAEPRRAVGSADGVRIDVMIRNDSVKPGSRVPITWEITNGRTGSIAVADLIPVSSYDAESGVIMVSLGSELPGTALLPRLLEIKPGQTRSFSGSAPVSFVRTPVALGVPRVEMQVRLNFLADLSGFEALLDIPERAVADPRLADELFARWIEKNEVIVTNALPMRWSAAREIEPTVPSRRRRP
jgi:hypothetical protein